MAFLYVQAVDLILMYWIALLFCVCEYFVLTLLLNVQYVEMYTYYYIVVIACCIETSFVETFYYSN